MGQNFLGAFEEVVLWTILTLGKTDAAYGVPIAEMIEEKTKKRVSTGALYTTLGRLEEKGLISSRMGEPSAIRGGRAKKYFTIEIAGRQALIDKQQNVNSFIADTQTI